MILGLDIGGTFIKYAWMREDGEILEEGKEPTPRTNQQDFIDTIRCIWKQREEPKTGIAISLPGTIDPTTGFVYQGGSLTYNHRCNVKEVLEEALHTSVSLENDARCAALAEMTSGNMKDITNGIVLVFGTGVGGCSIINKEIYRGSHLFAGEVSMLICKDLTIHGIQAVFGNIAGIPIFAKHVSELMQKEMDGVEVFQWIAKRDKQAMDAFQTYCKEVVTQFFNLQIMFDPEKLCIGGGVSANPIFLEGIQQAMNAFYDALPVPVPRLQIDACHYKNNANIVGAYINFIKQQEKMK